jgi:hypothetical protein
LTIAGVYLSPEGVVFGADSTSSTSGEDGFHFFDFNQKLFEVGQDSTLGLITWGLGGLGAVSYRTLIAMVADDLVANPPASVADVMQRWIARFWAEYSAYPPVLRCQTLAAMAAHGQADNGHGVRSEDEEKELAQQLRGLGVGFCIGGYVRPSRHPEAFSVYFSPVDPVPMPAGIAKDSISWFGVPNFFSRLLFGYEGQILAEIQSSPLWTGTQAELETIARRFSLIPPCTLPIRDAIDYVHTCIFSTIKAIKFSGISQVCGGPIEIAVVTSDRNFRWVRHKSWDAAIDDGGV